MNDHNGNTKTNSFNLSAAYHIPIGDGNKKNPEQKNQFSFGTSLSFAGMHFQGITENPNDPVYNDQERSEEHTSELQSRENLVCRLLLEKKNYYIMKTNK